MERYRPVFLPFPAWPWGIWDFKEKDYVRNKKGVSYKFRTAEKVVKFIERLNNRKEGRK